MICFPRRHTPIPSNVPGDVFVFEINNRDKIIYHKANNQYRYVIVSHHRDDNYISILYNYYNIIEQSANHIRI